MSHQLAAPEKLFLMVTYQTVHVVIAVQIVDSLALIPGKSLSYRQPLFCHESIG